MTRTTFPPELWFLFKLENRPSSLLSIYTIISEVQKIDKIMIYLVKSNLFQKSKFFITFFVITKHNIFRNFVRQKYWDTFKTYTILFSIDTIWRTTDDLLGRIDPMYQNGEKIWGSSSSVILRSFLFLNFIISNFRTAGDHGWTIDCDFWQ